MEHKGCQSENLHLPLVSTVSCFEIMEPVQNMENRPLKSKTSTKVLRQPQSFRRSPFQVSQFGWRVFWSCTVPNIPSWAYLFWKLCSSWRYVPINEYYSFFHMWFESWWSHLAGKIISFCKATEATSNLVIKYLCMVLCDLRFSSFYSFSL